MRLFTIVAVSTTLAFASWKLYRYYSKPKRIPRFPRPPKE